MSGKTRRGNGEGSVYQDKNRVWHAKLTVGRYRNGKPRYKEFKGKRKADVIARLNSYRREYGDLSLESGANMSFADYITRWLENVKRNEQNAAIDLHHVVRVVGVLRNVLGYLAGIFEGFVKDALLFRSPFRFINSF